MGRPHCVSLVNQLDYLVLRRDEVFSQPLNLNLLVLVFEDLEHLVVVEQVVNLAAVDLVHRNGNCKVPLIVLPVVDAAFKQVLHG